ncbi:uncharacterized protein F4817DRAFT_338953 [Daldinia loculata]|uniref:uncharacterized protein n=1 Tax=Daldinia loculata TaxID=103429 RepID=UPI0020C40989|nr:uncharacterized protein F4817DRAFT_338953 [Daldinia loculata]KAI1646966.1 hypothetical protein F4817DRAFT_338953 [Daldinia loculata]
MHPYVTANPSSFRRRNILQITSSNPVLVLERNTAVNQIQVSHLFIREYNYALKQLNLPKLKRHGPRCTPCRPAVTLVPKWRPPKFLE